MADAKGGSQASTYLVDLKVLILRESLGTYYEDLMSVFWLLIIL